MKRKGLKRTSGTVIALIGLLVILLIGGFTLAILIGLFRGSEIYSPSLTSEDASPTVKVSHPGIEGTWGLGCLGSYEPDSETVEYWARFKLPPSMQNLFSHSEGFQDCLVSVSFDMSPDDVPFLLSSSYVSDLDSVEGSVITFYTREVGWSFDDKVQYLYGHGRKEGANGYTTQNIVIDTRDTDLYHVYIQTYLN